MPCRLPFRGLRSRCGATLALLLLAVTASWGQGTQADYERAAQLGELSANRVYRQRVQPNWIGSGDQFWYRVQTGADTFRFVFVNPESGERRDAFDHGRLAEALSTALGRPVQADQLPFQRMDWDPAANRIAFRVGPQRFACDLASYVLSNDAATVGEDRSVVRLNRIRRSRNRGGETHIRFVNRLEEPVELFWIDAGGSPVSYGWLEPGAEREQHTYVGHVWMARISEERVGGIFLATEEPGDALIDGAIVVADGNPPGGAGEGTPSFRSPDGQWQLEWREENVWRIRVATGEAVQLTQDGAAQDMYLRPPHWSPDSAHVVLLQEQQPAPRIVHLIESSPADQLQPRLHSLPYPKPGDDIPRQRPKLFHLESGRSIPIAERLFATPWSITDLRWMKDGRRFTFLYNERGHQVLRIVVVDAATGEAGTLLEERSPTFLDYAHKMYANYLDGSDELIWMSERSGWNHLYRIDLQTGRLLNPITQGDWVVRRVDRVDENARAIWFYASGIFPEQDPYYLHYCRANFDGSGLVVLTQGNGTHEVELSPSAAFFIDRFSRVDQAPITELRSAQDGRRLCVLEEADDRALRATGWQPPVRFVAPGRDGTTPIYGVIHFPRVQEGNRKYPVIESIYAGPQDSFVPKTFSPYYSQQTLAELGFVVVQIDGMGTSNRSKAFHDVCWKNLGDSGFPDRIAWIRAAAAAYPQMDLTRVGLYGGSAGGQSTLRGLLAHPDFYHVGVADCGCHDNRIDKIWWNELWMGWPIGPHYDEQSNVTQAHRLQGKLLLTVGELDRNVDPASTYQVVNALIRANKDFELILFPGADHGAGESEYGRRRRADFFVRHLLGVEPRAVP